MDDLISRQDAIDAITDESIVRNMDSVYDSELHRCKRATHRILASLPSAQRNGKWMGTLFVCSVCGSGVRLMGKPMFEYCPWCGAKTEKGKNDG